MDGEWVGPSSVRIWSWFWDGRGGLGGKDMTNRDTLNKANDRELQDALGRVGFPA